MLQIFFCFLQNYPNKRYGLTDDVYLGRSLHHSEVIGDIYVDLLLLTMYSTIVCAYYA